MIKTRPSAATLAARIFTGLLAAFLVLFSLDVFDGQSGFWETAGGFMIHNIPSFILLLILAVSWKRPLAGAICYPLLAAAFLVTNLDAHWSVHLLITLPLLLCGALFLLAWKTNRPNQPAQTP